VAQVIVKAEGVPPLVRRSAKGSADIRIAALSVLRDVAKHGHSLVDSGLPPPPSPPPPFSGLSRMRICLKARMWSKKRGQGGGQVVASLALRDLVSHVPHALLRQALIIARDLHTEAVQHVEA